MRKSASKILRARYIKKDPKRLARLKRERTKAKQEALLVQAYEFGKQQGYLQALAIAKDLLLPKKSHKRQTS